MQDRQQIYGRNDMVMLEKHNKIYGSLGLTEQFVFDTIKGENRVVLKNPKEGNFENVVTNLTLYGKSQQDRTTGKNLFSSNYDEYMLPLNYYIYPLILNKGETYTVSIKSVSKIQNIAINILRSGRAYPFENTEVVFALLNLNDSMGDRKGTFTVDETFTAPAIAIYAKSKESFNSIFEAKEIQLEKGSIATSYEPYTGGKPSPSPDYPQEIKNVGDKGNVGVSVTGKNLLPNTVVLPDKTNKGIVWTYKSDGVYHVSGTSLGNFDSPILQLTDFNLSPGTYRMIDSENAIPQMVVTKSDGRDYRYTTKFTIEKGDKIKYWYCSVLNGKTIDTDVYAYLEFDTGIQPTKEDFEPYKPPQILTLLTPNGLPGIPVNSDGNYTDENGQQWVCDEIDLARGKYVQRIIKNIFDGSEEWRTWGANQNGNIGFYYYFNRDHSIKISDGKCISNYLSSDESAWNGEMIGVYVNGFESDIDYKYIVVSIKQSDLTDVSTNEMAIKSFREFLKSKKDSGTPFEFYCKLMKPIETDLPPEVIEQYSHIHTYYPTTIITIDGGELPVGVEVTYKQVNKGVTT